MILRSTSAESLVGTILNGNARFSCVFFFYMEVDLAPQFSLNEDTVTIFTCGGFWRQTAR